MRRKFPAGVLLALALLIPAAPAAAQAEAPVLNEQCQPVERKLFKDIRKLLTLDLDTATETEVRVLANQILSAAKADNLPGLQREMQERLDGTDEDRRAFLENGVVRVFTVDLRVSIARTLTGNHGPNVQAAAKKALDDGSIDASLAYLNEGVYAARQLDCAAQPTPTATATPSATPTATPTTTTSAAPAPTATADGGEGGGLPVTGSDVGTVAGIGGALLLLGGAGYLIGRRRRSRFVA